MAGIVRGPRLSLVTCPESPRTSVFLICFFLFGSNPFVQENEVSRLCVSSSGGEEGRGTHHEAHPLHCRHPNTRNTLLTSLTFANGTKVPFRRGVNYTLEAERPFKVCFFLLALPRAYTWQPSARRAVPSKSGPTERDAQSRSHRGWGEPWATPRIVGQMRASGGHSAEAPCMVWLGESLSGTAVEKPDRGLAPRPGLEPGTLPSQSVPQPGGPTV